MSAAMHREGYVRMRAGGAGVARFVVCLIVLGLCGGQGRGADVASGAGPDKRFQELMESIQRDPAGVPSERVTEFLQLGKTVGRPQAVAAVAKSYLAQRREAAPEVLLAAAEAAELAGDFRIAVARYKQYLKNPPPNADVAAARLSLFRLLVDYENAADDAYRVMTEMGDQARATPALRRYDAWYLAAARDRKDVPALVRRLAAVFADQMPLEMEREAYWWYLDWLIPPISSPTPALGPALPDCRKLAGLIREHPGRAARFRFATENLAFFLGSAGKDAATLDREFEAVAAAARAYFDAAPTAETYRDVLQFFGCGYERAMDPGIALAHPAAKQSVLAYGFDKLNDEQRALALNLGWGPYQAFSWATALVQPDQLVLRHPEPFRRCGYAGPIPVAWPTNSAVYKALAPAVQGLPSADAAVIAALGASDDIWACVQRLMQQTWFMPEFNQPMGYVQTIRAIYERYSRPKGQELPPDDGAKFLMRFGAEVFAKSPLAIFDPTSAGQMQWYAWGSCGQNARDKAKAPDYLHSLDWVPYTAEERQAIFKGIYDQFKAWAEGLRRDEPGVKDRLAQWTKALEDAQKARAAEAAKPAPNLAPLDQQLADVKKQFDLATADAAAVAAALASIAPLEEHFRKVMDPNVTDLAKAPDDTCRNLARAVIAIREKNLNAYLEAARAVYPTVREYPARKTPFGKAILGFLVRNRLETFDTLDFQCEVLADQLAIGAPDEGNAVAGDVGGAIFYSRPWALGQTPSAEKGKVLKVNAVFAKAIRDSLGRNKWPSDALVTSFLGTRRGADWAELERDQDLMEQLLARKDLIKPAPGMVTRLASLVRSDFPKLAEKYPPGRWFDDLYVNEFRQTRIVDTGAWYVSQDLTGKLVRAAAEVVQTYERVAMEYGAGPVLYADRKAFWAAHDRAMAAPAAERDAMLNRLESYFGKTRFDFYANGAARISVTAATTPEERKQYFAKLAAWLDARAQEPVVPFSPVPNAIAGMKPEDLAPDELNVLIRWVRSQPTWAALAPGQLITLVQQGLVAQKRENELLPLLPSLWRLAVTVGYGYPAGMAQTAVGLADKGMVELATSSAAIGLKLAGNNLNETERSALTTVRSRALSGLLAVVAVDPADRRYPVFRAQANYQIGRMDDAWQTILANRQLVQDSFKELDPGFTIWVIDRLTDAGSQDDAEALARAVIAWAESVPQAIASEDRAGLMLAYGQISFARREYPRARAVFEQVAAAKEFQSTMAQKNAELRIADIDRLTKHFDKAIDRLENLLRQPDRYLQAEAGTQLAQVKFDQEEYPEARASLDQVLAIAPNHPNARILEGKLNLQLKKLIEATEVKVGLAASQQALVPGQPLKIGLEDRNLAVVGQSGSVEIRAWVDSGDEELFNLLPFGDSKTKFEGRLPTALATTAKGNHTLDVLGGDVVHYDFSEGFKRAHKISAQAPVTLRVISDSELYISSGKLLTRQEQEQRKLERTIRERLNLKEAPSMALSAVRAEDEIKPGNPINVMVIDPDRSVSAGKDRIRLGVASSSGDRLAGVELEETSEYSGVFQGRIPTASAPATGFATDSQEGKEPNFAVSGGDYPPWVALPDNKRPKLFTVDLNNSVVPARMTVAADVPGRRLKRFALQTSPNGREFLTVAAWPDRLAPWRGDCTMELVRFVADKPEPGPLGEFRDYLQAGYMAAGVEKVTVTNAPIELKWDHMLGGFVDRLQLPYDGAGNCAIGHIQACFYMPKRQTRTFRVVSEGPPNLPRIIAIDGVPSETQNASEIVRSLGKGVHRLDVYFTAFRRVPPAFHLQQDIPEAPYFARVVPANLGLPADLDPKERDAWLQTVAFEPGAVTAAADGGSFDIEMNARAQTRMLRLMLLDFETDAPAIRKIGLTDRDGQTVLPTKEDLVMLKDNQVLELVPGDRITITYEDPSCLGKERQFTEAFMKATFRNAELSACFIESYTDQYGSRHPIYIPMRRFRIGDTLNVFIRDADCDVSEKADTVEFTAKCGAGKAIKLNALETEPHSGVFLGKVFPVPGEPQRESEMTVHTNEDVLIGYMDRENTDPGVPTTRSFTAEQAGDAVPKLRAYEFTTRALADEELRAEAAKRSSGRIDEIVPVTRAVAAKLPDTLDAPGTVLIGCPLIVDLIDPASALSPLSRMSIYVQTSAGRQKFGKPLEGAFDPRVPGTLRIETAPGECSTIDPPPGYANVLIVREPYATTPMDDGRFTFRIPMELGAVPAESFAVPRPGVEGASGKPDAEDAALRIRGNDEVFIGLQRKGAGGTNEWMVRTARVTCDPFFDVMDRRYRDSVSALHVGETLYFRIANPSRDLSDEKDAVEVALRAGTGQPLTVRLTETYAHSGVFKGLWPTAFAGSQTPETAKGFLEVQYGDTVTAEYKPEGATEPLTRTIRMHKGADGSAQLFTKRFADPSIAVQTQFTVAEAYFEVAKKHREIGQEELARREIGQGKKLLEEAVRDHPRSDARAQADYLLADLALEFANDTKDAEAKRRYYAGAIMRFGDVVASYPDSAYAPRSQFKKALTYEKMGAMDEACEEYVKLSYRYPDNELVAETIARLGQYFLEKGKGFQAQMTAEPDAVAREKIRLQSIEMYRTAAQVFGRLAARFPDHRLAGKTTLLSGQCYMRAEDVTRAIGVFKKLIDARQADSELLAEAMYWCGDCYMRKSDNVNAYRMFKKLTWDYPETLWAKYARGRLTEPVLVAAERTAEEEEATR